jgi:hypothetical protein
MNGIALTGGNAFDVAFDDEVFRFGDVFADVCDFAFFDLNRTGTSRTAGLNGLVRIFCRITSLICPLNRH